MYSLKDFVDAADRIRNNIPDRLYDEGFVFVSLDTKSLFTNVLLEKTMNVILGRFYNQRLITTNLKKRTLKKLIDDTCNKTAFLVNGTVCEQIDGVSMGASFWACAGENNHARLERAVVDDLITNETLNSRYVDDTLIMVKPNHVDAVLQKFNQFH